VAITQTQVQLISEAHTVGLLDLAIAEYAGVSLSTVKRVRKKLGLQTNCQTTLRGRLGERIVAERAQQRGLGVEWRQYDNHPYDLIIQGHRVDAKAAMQLSDGTWKFRLHETRRSFHGRYRYHKDYARDCDVVVLVCLSLDGSEPTLYLFRSVSLPGTIHIHPRGSFALAREAWEHLSPAALSQQAA